MKKILSQIARMIRKKTEPKLSKKQTEELVAHVRQAFEHDQADYDGMGNWGRFPPEKK